MTSQNHKAIAAIFDLDGTLFTGHFWLGLVRYFFDNKMRRLPTSTFIAAHMPLWLAGRLKIIHEDTAKRIWGEDMSFLLKGMDRQEVLGIYHSIVEDYLVPRLRQDVVDLLESHKQKGHTTILLSGSFHCFIELVRDRLGMDYATGTRVEVENGVYSGRIIKPMGFGKHKIDILEKLIEKEKLDVDFERSFAYADSVSDAPLLDITGNPVATYPDEGLLALARDRGWQIVNDGKGA